MTWIEYTKHLLRVSIIPLSELRQEILHLKQNRTFNRNLCLMSLTILISSISVADIYHHPYTIAKQEKCNQLFQAMSAAAVIKTYQTFPQ